MLPADGFRMRSRRVLNLVLFAVLAVGSIAAIPSPASAAEGTPTVEVTGHGWGHGWGLGQYGAYGYATDYGWSSAQILDHYYGNTAAGSIPATAALDPDELRIDIRSDRGAPTVIAVTSGVINLWRGSDDSPAGTFANQVIRLSMEGDGFRVERLDGCGGQVQETYGDIAGESHIRVTVTDGVAGRDGLLSYCRSDGRQIWYPGELEAVKVDSAGLMNKNGVLPRTVNVVSLEDYLRGVVPKEVPAWWGDEGPAALEAQSVAARSYVMSRDDRYTAKNGTPLFADSCDTTLCQVYGGWYDSSLVGALKPNGAVFDPRTDLAVTNTAGLVRIRNDNGKIARTYFSSSTGGYTSAIDPFPAVEDLGDAVAANPNHEWARTLDLTSLENSSGLGAVQELRVSQGNGLSGKWNDAGRVLQVEVWFENGIKTYTGAAFRSAFGLKSDWFSFDDVLRDGIAVAANGRFVDTASNVFLGRAPTSAERQAWVGQVNAGNKVDFLTGLANSDEWAGSLIDDLYHDVLGREADAAGRAYWRGEMAAGFRFEEVGTYFYGSPEYFNSVGGTNALFVTSLYKRILERDPEPAGFEYWLGIMDQNIGDTVVVSSSFYVSAESRQQRTRSLFDKILARSPETAGLLFWSQRLDVITDLQLAVELAMTAEFEALATAR